MSSTQLLQNDTGPLERYGTGAIDFAGSDSDLYERHLLFDNVVPAAGAGRARSLRGIRRGPAGIALSQRWTS